MYLLNSVIILCVIKRGEYANRAWKLRVPLHGTMFFATCQVRLEPTATAKPNSFSFHTATTCLFAPPPPLFGCCAIRKNENKSNEVGIHNTLYKHTLKYKHQNSRPYIKVTL